MQLCGMVSLQMLENQGKLQELLPIAQETLSNEKSGIEGKITAMGLFRKILMQAILPGSSVDQKEKAVGYLDQLIPSLFTILRGQEESPKQIELKVQVLHTLTLICEKYPTIDLQKHTRSLKAILTKLIDSKKRVIRKFSRNLMNEWMMIWI